MTAVNAILTLGCIFFAGMYFGERNLKSHYSMWKDYWYNSSEMYRKRCFELQDKINGKYKLTKK